MAIGGLSLWTVAVSRIGFNFADLALRGVLNEKGSMPSRSETVSMSRSGACHARHPHTPSFPRPTALLLAVLLLGTASNPVASLGWQPQGRPPGIQGRLQVKMTVIDHSRSVAGMTRSPRLRAAGRHAIATARPGTYVIVGSFGTTARVLADRFVFDDRDRKILFDAVESICMDAQHTDVDRLEGMIKDIRIALASAFGAAGFQLEVEVLTDGEPDPAPKNSVTQTFDVLSGQPTFRTDLGEGLFLYQATFSSSAEPTLTPFATPRLPAATQLPRRDPPRGHLVGRAAWPTIEVGRWESIGFAVASLLVALLLTGRLRRREAINAEGSDIAQFSNVLVVTETDESNGHREIHRDCEVLPIVPDAPILFGVDAGRCACLVRPMPGITDGEFFRVTLSGSGLVRLEAIPGTLCNGKPVSKRGRTFANREAFNVRIHDREWKIAIKQSQADWAGMDALFGSIRADGMTAASPARGADQ